MKVPVKLDYACRVLVQLARRRGAGRLVHVEDLAAAEAVPANYLVQILGELREAGLVESRRGKEGGYALARDAAAVTLLDVVRAVEGSLLDPPVPESGTGGRVAGAWQSLREAAEGRAATITLEWLAEEGAAPMWFI